MKKQLLLFLTLLFISTGLFATHNQAGEFRYKQMEDNPLMIEASAVTYTKASSVAADRDSLSICWENNICDWVYRTNGVDTDNNGIPDGELIGPDTKINIYTAVHTYPGPGNYTISMTDPNRNGGILNVNWPNSEIVPFIIRAEISILNGAFNEPVESPILLQPPIDFAFVGEPFLHTPNAYSPTGDSIAYQLISPIDVPNYVQVTDIAAGWNNNLTLNPTTGLLVWDAPQQAGLYTIAYLVKFYRNGEEIGSLIRDMQIEVVEAFGTPPTITMNNVNGNTEVIFVDLGDTIDLEISAEDADISLELQLTASSGLFDFFDHPATFNITENQGHFVVANFQWIVREEHLRAQPYQLVARAENNAFNHPMSALRIVRYQTNGVFTNVSEVSDLPKIDIFPNPVIDGYLQLSTKEGEALRGNYEILNTLGQIVQKGNIRGRAIEVNNLNPGNYFLRIENNQQYGTSSFVVQ